MHYKNLTIYNFSRCFLKAIYLSIYRSKLIYLCTVSLFVSKDFLTVATCEFFYNTIISYLQFLHNIVSSNFISYFYTNTQKPFKEFFKYCSKGLFVHNISRQQIQNFNVANYNLKPTLLFCEVRDFSLEY